MNLDDLLLRLRDSESVSGDRLVAGFRLEVLRDAEAVDPEALVRGFRVDLGLERLKASESRVPTMRRPALRWWRIGVAAAFVLSFATIFVPRPRVTPPVPLARESTVDELWERAKAGDSDAEAALRPAHIRPEDDLELSIRVLARCSPPRAWGRTGADRPELVYRNARAVAPAHARQWLRANWTREDVLEAVAADLDETDARAVARAFATLPSEPAIDVLRRHRRAAAPEIRAAMARDPKPYLGLAEELAWPELTTAVARWLDEDETRFAALAALREIGDDEALREIAARWEKHAEDLYEGMRSFGPKAVGELERLARKGSRSAVECLGAIPGEKSLEALLRLAGTGVAGRPSLEALAKRPEERAFEPVLAASLGRLDRSAAAKLLARVDDDVVIPALIEALQSSRTRDRAHRLLKERTGNDFPARASEWERWWNNS